MRLLVGLRRLEADVIALKIGAAVLPVGVEEEVVEPVRKVVVVRDVTLRLTAIVQLIEPRRDLLRAPQLHPERIVVGPAGIVADEVEEIGNAALGEPHPGIHEGFGGAERRVEAQSGAAPRGRRSRSTPAPTLRSAARNGKYGGPQT